MKSIAFIDSEIDSKKGEILDLGAVTEDGSSFHASSVRDFTEFVMGKDYLCGHNILKHDLKYLQAHLLNAGIDTGKAIDTLLLSPLLFPKKPYHALLKDDKLNTDELNNPLNDAIKAKELFYDELSAFSKLDDSLKQIYYSLLGSTFEFAAFFEFVSQKGSGLSQNSWNNQSKDNISNLIFKYFEGKICAHANIEQMISSAPRALAYALALIDIMEDEGEQRSLTPAWVLRNYPEVEGIIFRLRSKPCLRGCEYCEKSLDIHAALSKYFGFSNFRSYGGEPLQERAVKAAVENKSLLAIFPTGGGKSLSFQLPALMAGQNARGLTVVISPLQSLMKDQVDNLETKGITEAVTINGLLDPIERAKSFERLEDGRASILYIAPESLRSASVERILLKRNIARFVIDEAHCFSAWGQDFRVDYMYIAEFIRSIQCQKALPESIPVSCFTATAKPQVIEDIKKYFLDELNLELELFQTTVSRTNLHYKVLPEKNDASKYNALRALLDQSDGPAIVYVSRTKKAEELAQKLSIDGFPAKPYHGKMAVKDKVRNQNSFMEGKTRIIVATSAFGMGVDKSDVSMVIHYEISNSLENYVQEAGRAGRDENIQADCYVLYNDDDLNKHFIMLNQTKITIKEIQQIWKAIKELTKLRSKISNSALEIARLAGWDEGISDLETRVRTAINSLELAGFLKRGKNSPRVYATGILAKNAQEAIDKIEASSSFDQKDKVLAIRVIKNLVANRARKEASGEEAESRVDYLADILGVSKAEVVNVVNLLRQERILADSKDLIVYFGEGETIRKPQRTLKEYVEVENFLAPYVSEEDVRLDYKLLNEEAASKGLRAVNLKRIKIILNFWAIKGWINKHNSQDGRVVEISSTLKNSNFLDKIQYRQALSAFVVEYLYELAQREVNSKTKDGYLEFSELEILQAYKEKQELFSSKEISIDDIEEALFFLSRIEAIRIEGGFMVIYNSMNIERLEQDNSKRYTKENYQKLNQFYEGRIQQIHIVGEYAKKMIEDYEAALRFVDDYFTMNQPMFLHTYFRDRRREISRNISPAKFKQIFGELSPSQLKIINDKDSKYITVGAGPGSGKTRVLVHKLASLMIMEDVRSEQLLMLTFSRAAATEFKSRLISLIGNAAAFVQVTTFHSYCFDLLGRIGNLDRAKEVVSMAVEKIKNGEVDNSKITKTVLVIDEAQDMSKEEYDLVEALMRHNEDMRVIAVGDDDQNIYEFRGSSSEYMQKFLDSPEGKKYELVENYRSAKNLVEFANKLVSTISHRFKQYPIVPNSSDLGQLKLVKHVSENLEVPVVDDILSTTLKGSTAVMTRTNDEALNILGLLLKAGIPARLIQSNEGFSLDKLDELRFFISELEQQSGSPIIDDEDWTEAKRKFFSNYSRSNKLDLCAKLLNNFERIAPKTKYLSDFKTFVGESGMEDFEDGDTSTVIVSTLHKSKGKEFDNVFLCLKNTNPREDKDIRPIYVAVTRAKKNLYIHENRNYLSRLSITDMQRSSDTSEYSSPDEVILQPGHRDVWLSFSENIQKELSQLRSGDELQIGPRGEILNREGKEVVKFSKKFKAEHLGRITKDYHLQKAEVNFIVWWKDKDKQDAEPIRILLPRLYFVK